MKPNEIIQAKVTRQKILCWLGWQRINSKSSWRRPFYSGREMRLMDCDRCISLVGEMPRWKHQAGEWGKEGRKNHRRQRLDKPTKVEIISGSFHTWHSRGSSLRCHLQTILQEWATDSQPWVRVPRVDNSRTAYTILPDRLPSHSNSPSNWLVRVFVGVLPLRFVSVEDIAVFSGPK